MEQSPADPGCSPTRSRSLLTHGRGAEHPGVPNPGLRGRDTHLGAPSGCSSTAQGCRRVSGAPCPTQHPAARSSGSQPGPRRGSGDGVGCRAGCHAGCHTGCCSGCHARCHARCHAGSAVWPHPMARLGAIFGPGWPEQSRAGGCHGGGTALVLWFCWKGPSKVKSEPLPSAFPYLGQPKATAPPACGCRGAGAAPAPAPQQLWDAAAPRGSFWCLLLVPLRLSSPELLLEPSVSESVLNKQTTDTKFLTAR